MEGERKGEEFRNEWHEFAEEHWCRYLHWNYNSSYTGTGSLEEEALTGQQVESFRPPALKHLRHMSAVHTM